MEVSTRKPYFIEEEDDGLASLAEMEAAGVSSQNAVFSSPFCYTRRSSLRSMNYLYPPSYYHHQYSVSSPRSAVSGRFHDPRFENSHYSRHQPYFLDSCFLCKKSLDNRDIYMYRGDTPFCSEECRQEKIEKDEAKEKRQNLSSSVKKAMRRKEQRSSTSSSAATSPTPSPDYAFPSQTLAAA